MTTADRQESTYAPQPGANAVAPARAMTWLLALAVFMPLLSLPPFALGFWERVEPLQVGFHLLCGLIALGLAWMTWQAPGTAWRILRLPVVWLPLAAGAWSAAIAGTTAYPWLSVLGAPQSGEGALWQAGTAVLVAGALAARRSPGFWPIIHAAACTSAALLIALLIVERLAESALLAPIPDYYGFIAVLLPFVGLPFRGSEAGRYACVRLVLPAVLGAILAVLSLNASALAGFAVATGLAGLGLWIGGRGRKLAWLESRPVLAGGIGLAAVFPYLALRFIEPAQEIYSVKARQLVLRIVAGGEEATARDWLLGNGWGHITEAFVTDLNATGIRLYDSDWDILWRDYFHSHNWLAEALYSAGLPAVLLLLGFFVAIVLRARPDMRLPAAGLAIGYTLTLGFWPPLAFVPVFLALAVAAVTVDFDDSGAPARRTTPVRAAGVAVLLLAAAHLATGITLWRFGGEVSEIRQALRGNPSALTERHFPYDPRGSELPLSSVAAAYEWNLSNQVGGPFAGPTSPANRARVDWVLTELAREMVARPSPTLAATAVSWQATLHLHPRLQALNDLQHLKDATWRAWTLAAIDAAPQRTDLAIPYLTAAINDGRYPEVTDFAERMLSRNRNDPVGLYFLGASLTGHPDRGIKIEGLKFIAESLEEGIERFMPVPAELQRLARQAARS